MHLPQLHFVRLTLVSKDVIQFDKKTETVIIVKMSFLPQKIVYVNSNRANIYSTFYKCCVCWWLDYVYLYTSVGYLKRTLHIFICNKKNCLPRLENIKWVLCVLYINTIVNSTQKKTLLLNNNKKIPANGSMC